MARERRDRGLARRLMPTRLASRMSRSMVVAAAVVFIALGVIFGRSLSIYTRSLARHESQNNLTEVRYALSLQTQSLGALSVGFTEWEEFYRQTSAPDPAFITTEFDPWLAERSNASTIVWADSHGDVISSSGDSADIQALLRMSRENQTGVSGLASLPGGPAMVSIEPIIGDPPAPSAGTLAVARTIRSEGLLDRSIADLALIPAVADPGADGWRAVTSPDGYASTVARIKEGRYLMQAVLTGIDNKPVVALELSRPDPWLGEGRVWIIFLLPLALGVVTLVTGHFLGTWIGNSIGRPLHGFVAYVQDQGYLALQGLRTDEDLRIDPGLPEDVAELGHVIADLMTQLRVNQAELIEAGDQALAAERAFRTVVEESPELKILVRGGVVEIANPAAAHFFGLQLGDLLRAEPDGLFSVVQLFDEDGKAVQLLNIARLADRAPVTARCVSPDQPDRWIEFSVAFIDPEEYDYVISARNITEERRLDALREEVVSLVSHDLRSPLTVVRGYLDILDKPLDDERRKTAVDSARRSALRMEDLLNDLLHATRAERVFAPKVMRPVDIAVLVEGVATSLQMSAQQTITVSLDPGVTVLGDPIRLEQAVTNLIGNAIKHGPPDGEVRVTVCAANGRAIVAIEDDGPGIPADERERVFERGARGPASQGTPGMGLGLYIVRVVAEAHGGIAFVDQSESGTRFVLDLPIVEPLVEGH